MSNKQWFEIEVTDRADQKCDTCNGHGYVWLEDLSDTEVCLKCGGTGEIVVGKWEVVAKIKSRGLANLIVHLLQPHYKDRIRVKR